MSGNNAAYLHCCHTFERIQMKTKKIDYAQFLSLPAFFIYFFFFILPLLCGIGMSFTDWDGIGKASFIGFENFITFFHDKRAMHDIQTTIIFAIGSAVLLNLVGLIYALLMSMEFKLKNIARGIIYLPAIISPLIMGYIWYFLIQPGRGFLHYAFLQLNMTDFIGNWMVSYASTMTVLILINVWQFSGMTMIIYIAGLQGISSEMTESAKIDGANSVQCFFRVILPLLMPAIRIHVVTNIIGSLSVFDVIMSLTEGGPGYQTESLSIYIMRMCYGSRTGYSTAVAIILFLIILVPVVIAMKLTKNRS